MNKTGKIILIIIIILAIGLIGYVSTLSPQGGEKEIVKIGVIMPLTGGQANLGQSAKNAVLLAQEKLGKTKFNYQVIFEDDALDQKLTSNAANKLINLDKVNALISFTSGSGNVITPLATDNKVIHICVASDPNIAKGDYNFLHWTTPAEEDRVWIEEAIKRGIKKVATIQFNQQGQYALLDDLKKQIQGKDIEIVDSQFANTGNRDFRAMIEKAKSKNPEAIFIGFFSPELEVFAKQYKELGVNIPLTTIESFEYTEQPELFEGRWYVQSAQAADEFSQNFQTKFNDNPKLGSPFVFDAFNLIVSAFEKADEVNNEKAMKELSQIKDFPSAVGKIFVGDEGIVWSQAVVREIRDGKPVTIK